MNSISIIMPLKNGMPFLQETLLSIKNQTYSNWELLIIDASSTDGSIELVNSFNDSRFKVIKRDLGPGLARNYGISISNGEYLAFIDSDDIWHEEKLDIQLKEMVKNNFLYTYTNYSWIDTKTNLLGRNHYFLHKMNYQTFFSKRIIVMSSVMIKKDILKDLELTAYDGFAEDLYFHGKILQKGIVAFGIDKYLLSYRKHKKSRSKDVISNQIAVWKLYRNQFNLSFMESILMYSLYILDVAYRRLFKIN